MKKYVTIIAFSCFMQTGIAQNNELHLQPESTEANATNNWHIITTLSVGFLAVSSLLYVAKKNNSALKSQLQQFEEKGKRYEKVLFEKSNAITELNREVVKVNRQLMALYPKEDEAVEEAVLEMQVNNNDESNALSMGLRFFGNPNKEGFFETIEIEEAKASYVFEFENENTTTASVKLHNLQPNRVQEYLSSPKIYLDPVCDQLNVITSRMTDIQIVKSGVVTLQDDKWIVTQKAVIKFI